MPIPILAIATALAQFAPTVIKYFAGDKAGDTAQEVVNIATSVTGASSPEEALQKLTMSTEAQMKFKAQILDAQIKWDEIYLKDVQSARMRQVESEKATGKRDYNLYVIAWTVIILFYALVAVLCFQIVPDANLGPVNQLFGAMAAGFGMVLAYFFGSSRGSAIKSETLENIVKNGKETKS